jgi:hypothetical protein
MAALVVCVVATSTCSGSILGPSCRDEQGNVLIESGLVAAHGTVAYTVASPKSSNLIIRLTWDQPDATLDLSATITDCGGHTGCSKDRLTPSFGPGGPSPTPLPWPPGVREMQVDGWQGKTYRVEIGGDPLRDASYRLSVVYDISCES